MSYSTICYVASHPEDMPIRTTVTAFAADVDYWIASILKSNQPRLSNLIVGLDTEWRLCKEPDGHQKVALIQLCVGYDCLLFQLYNADYIPKSLIAFLGNKDFIFTGKEVRKDAAKLLQDYDMVVSNTLDVAHLAAEKYKVKEYRNKGLKALGEELVKISIEKSKRYSLSRWDAVNLSFDQIKYATLDAFVSFKLGAFLIQDPS